MKYFHFKRLEKLATFLDQLPEQKFDFAKLAEEGNKPMLDALAAREESCGTVACAMGWTPALFPKLVMWGNKRDFKDRFGNRDLVSKASGSSYLFKITEELFGISVGEGRSLFLPGFYSGLGDNATAQEVAVKIRKFIAEKKSESK